MISLNTAAIRGTATGANRGVYTARLCSGGKYRRASIPGLKNAREAAVNACAECWNARSGDVERVLWSCLCIWLVSGLVNERVDEIGMEGIEEKGCGKKRIEG